MSFKSTEFGWIAEVRQGDQHLAIAGAVEGCAQLRTVAVAASTLIGRAQATLLTDVMLGRVLALGMESPLNRSCPIGPGLMTPTARELSR